MKQITTIHEAYCPPEQKIYDIFNEFIFSNEQHILGKLLLRHSFYLRTIHIPGNIVECGVYKGSGMASWLKFIQMYEPKSSRKIIGFDFFENGDETVKIIKKEDYKYKDQLIDVINRIHDKEDLSLESVNEKIKSIDKRYELIKGDIKISSEQFCKKNPGFHISILYLDMDLAEPTYHALKSMWDRVLPGGIVIFDDYRNMAFDEANGAHKFFKEINYEPEIISTYQICPDAYIIKK